PEPPAPERANCLVQDNSGPGSGYCKLAGPQCSEQAGAVVESCVLLAEDYCVPAVLCTCAQMTDPNACVANVVTMGVAAGEMTHLQCTIPLDRSGSPCLTMPATADFSALFGSSAAACTGIGVADLATPFGPFVADMPIDHGHLSVTNFAPRCKA